MVQIVRYFQMRYRTNQMIALLEEKRGCHAVDRALLFAEKSCHASGSVLLRKEKGYHAVDRALLFTEKGCHASRSVLLRKEKGCHAVDRALLFAEKSCHASRSVLLRKERSCHAVNRALWDKKKHGQWSWMTLWNVAKGGLHSVTPFVRYGKRSTFAAASGR